MSALSFSRNFVVRAALTGIVVSLIATTGCNVKQPDLYPEQANTPSAAPAPPAEKPATDPQTTEPEAAPAATPSDGTLVKADVGVGSKGRDYGGEKDGIMAPITTPIATYFAMQEQTVFRMKIPHAMQLYKAQNDNKPPPDMESYMRDIIQANNIVLPELKPGDEYVYDPEQSEELMVRKSGK